MPTYLKTPLCAHPRCAHHCVTQLQCVCIQVWEGQRKCRSEQLGYTTCTTYYDKEKADWRRKVQAGDMLLRPVCRCVHGVCCVCVSLIVWLIVWLNVWLSIVVPCALPWVCTA
jgi:hypothetical protein